MKKNLFIIILLLFSIQHDICATEKLSEKAEISLISCSPGDVLYLAFGHSAVRVFDPVNNFDHVYNYGTFDFNAPNFYLKFIRGQLEYMLSKASFNRFLAVYRHENRTVSEQVLNLTHEDKNKLYQLLEINYMPENRFYNYDFYFDNCASRIRDILQKALGDKLEFKSDSADNLSFRQLTDLYLEHQPWGDFGIDLALGADIDKKASYSEQMYLPDYLRNAFADAQLKQNNKTIPLIKENRILNKATVIDETVLWIAHPFYLFSLITLIVMAVSLLAYKKQYKAFFDVFLFSIFGLIGVLILFLWFATDHNGTAHNYNLLWAFPFHFIAAFMLLGKKHTFLQWYFKGNLVLNVLILLLWFFIPQNLNTSIIPLILLQAFRSFIISRKINRV